MVGYVVAAVCNVEAVGFDSGSVVVDTAVVEMVVELEVLSWVIAVAVLGNLS